MALAVQRATRYPRLWWSFFKNCVAREMEYRGHFFMAMLVDIVWYGVQLGLFQTVYGFVPVIGGWDKPQMTVFLGTLFVVDGLNMFLIAHNFWDFPNRISTGEIDFYLLKPVSPFFMSFFRYINPASLGNLVMGIAVLITGIVQAHLQPTPWQVALYLLLLACGSAVYLAFEVIVSTFCIFTVGGDGYQSIFHQFYQFGMKPDAIYGNFARRLFRYVFMVSLIASVPASLLVGKLQAGLAVWAVVAAVGFLALAMWFFRWSLRYYKGASA